MKNTILKKPAMILVFGFLLIIVFLLVSAGARDNAYNEYAEELFQNAPLKSIVLNWCEKFPNANREAIDTYLLFRQQPSEGSPVATSVKTCEPLGVYMEVMDEELIESEKWLLLRWEENGVKQWGWQKENVL